MKIDCGFTSGIKWFRYRAAAIIVENGCVLLARNEKSDYYYSVGGGVHVGETAEAAVKREVWEETGVAYEVDRLVIVHENFFQDNGMDCHEVALYYLMKPRDSQELNSDSYTQGVRETMHWIPISDLDNHVAYPTFLKDELPLLGSTIKHIVTDERA